MPYVNSVLIRGRRHIDDDYLSKRFICEELSVDMVEKLSNEIPTLIYVNETTEPELKGSKRKPR